MGSGGIHRGGGWVGKGGDVYVARGWGLATGSSPPTRATQASHTCPPDRVPLIPTTPAPTDFPTPYALRHPFSSVDAY